jgi:hypothetical protein
MPSEHRILLDLTPHPLIGVLTSFGDVWLRRLPDAREEVNGSHGIENSLTRSEADVHVALRVMTQNGNEIE